MEQQKICLDNVDRIIKTYADMLLHLAIAKTRNREYSEEIVQEVFLRLLEYDKCFESEEHVKAWLIRVTINQCKKLWSSSWYRRTVPYTEYREESCEMKEKSEVYYALLELPEKYRMVLHLYYYEDMSVKEIATMLEMKPATVETRIHRARALLKKKLKGEYDYA